MILFAVGDTTLAFIVTTICGTVASMFTAYLGAKYGARFGAKESIEENTEVTREVKAGVDEAAIHARRAAQVGRATLQKVSGKDQDVKSLQDQIQELQNESGLLKKDHFKGEPKNGG